MKSCSMKSVVQVIGWGQLHKKNFHEAFKRRGWNLVFRHIGKNPQGQEGGQEMRKVYRAGQM